MTDADKEALYLVELKKLQERFRVDFAGDDSNRCLDYQNREIELLSSRIRGYY